MINSMEQNQELPVSYTALYRKWRPKTFEEVKGQEHITITLQNQIKTDRVGHAYLFCGTRGTGKTSAAKIFARAVNCLNPTAEGSPCNECEVCRSILSGASMNVIEIDAASNNGVDSIRQIRDEVQYSPTDGKYKVYIIDEVHMLSIGAFNALLKTLEEPPAYVIFILATTEVHKIPITILSRCQRYDFKRISNQTIWQQLTDLTAKEDIPAQERALRYIAKAADGSMRDALSLLEQCVSFYFGQELTYENVLDVLGAVDTSVFSTLLAAVLKKEVAECVRLINELTERGRDLNQFVIDFIWYMRNLLLIQTAEGAEALLEMSPDNMAALRREAEQMDTDTLVRYIRILSELSNQMKYASAKRVLLEITLVKLMKPAMEQDMASLMQRMSEMEQTVQKMELGVVSAGGSLGTTGSMEVRQGTMRQTSQEAAEEPKPEPEVIEVTQAVYDDYEMIRHNWAKVMAAQTPFLMSILKKCRFSYQEGKGFVLKCEEAWMYKLLSNQESDSIQAVCDTVQRLCGKSIEIQTVMASEDSAPDARLVVGTHIPGIQMEVEEEG